MFLSNKMSNSMNLGKHAISLGLSNFLQFYVPRAMIITSNPHKITSKKCRYSKVIL